MKDKQAKYPQLRFKGFTDPWEERRLSEIVTEHNSGVYIAKDEYGSGTNIIGVGDIYESDLVDGQVFRLAPVKDEKFILHSRDLLYGESSLVQEGIARVVSVTDKGAGTAFAWHTRRFVVEPVVADSQFVMLELNYWFPAREHLMRTATKTALTGITTQDFFSTNILVPILLEQKKICDLVRLLDNLITVNQRKLAKLKELKQGYLQKLFPKNGAKVPELRFAGFTDAWEQRKLGEVATFLNGRAYKQDELLDSGKYKVLRVGNFYTNDSWYYSNMELGDKYYVDKGDLVYTWSATFGPHIWSGEKVIYHYHIWKVELSKFLDRNFTLQLLEADKARLLSSTNGSTMIHVTKGDMESKIVSIPNIDEQKQIGSFFKQLDDTIALHQRKLDLLKEQKKGFLQNMFV